MSLDPTMAYQRVEASRLVYDASVMQFTASAALDSREGMERSRADAHSALDAHLDAIAVQRGVITDHVRKSFRR